MEIVKKLLLVGMVAAMGFTAAACSEEVPEALTVDNASETSMYLRTDGSLSVAYVEEFTENYYSGAGLSEYASELADYYNKLNGTDIKVDGVKAAGGKATLLMSFDNADAFTGFDEGDSFLVNSYDKEAAQTEFNDLSFISARKSKVVGTGSDVIKKGQAIAEVNGACLVQTEGKILYYSEGELIDNYHIRVFDGENAVIIYKIN